MARQLEGLEVDGKVLPHRLPEAVERQRGERVPAGKEHGGGLAGLGGPEDAEGPRRPDALQAVFLRHRGELREERKRRAEAAVARGLLPAGLAVAVHEGRALALVDHHARPLAPLGVKHRAQRHDEVRGALDPRLLRDEDVDLRDLLQIWQHPQPLRAGGPPQLLARTDVGKHDDVVRLHLVLHPGAPVGAGEMQPVRGRLPDDLGGGHWLDLQHCEAAEQPVHVQLGRLLTQGEVLVAEEAGGQVEPRAAGIGGARERAEVPARRVVQRAPQVEQALAQGPRPGLLQHLVGHDRNPGVAPRLRQGGELLEKPDQIQWPAARGRLRLPEGGEGVQHRGHHLAGRAQAVVRQQQRQQLLRVALEPGLDLRLVATHQAGEEALVREEGGEQSGRAAERSARLCAPEQRAHDDGLSCALVPGREGVATEVGLDGLGERRGALRRQLRGAGRGARALLPRQQEVARERPHRLHLAGVGEVERGQQLTRGDDGARRQRLVDLPGRGRLEGHDHLHGLQLHERGALGDAIAVRLEVADHLPVEVGAQLRGVADAGEREGDTALYAQTQGERLLLAGHLRDAVAALDVEGAVWLLADLGLDGPAPDGEAVRLLVRAAHLPYVLRVVVRGLHHEGLQQPQVGSQREVPAAEGAEGLLGAGLHVHKGPEAGGVEDRVEEVELGLHRLFGEELVEPGGVDGVLAELLRVRKLHQVLGGRADLALDRHAPQSELQGSPRVLPRRPPGEDVAELGVGKFMDAAVRPDGEVAPRVRGGLEPGALDLPGGRPERVVGVLRRDARGHDVGLRVHVLILEEVDPGVTRGVAAVEAAHVRTAVQGDAHAHLELQSRHVDPGDALGDRVLHLEPRVELQEIEPVGLRLVQVLHGARAPVADRHGKALGRLLRDLAEVLPGSDRRGALLEDLLEPALRGAVAADERDDLPVLIPDQLHLEVARAGAELHHEDGGARHLGGDLLPAQLELLVVGALPDALAASPLRCLQHHGVADAADVVAGLLQGLQACPLEGLLWDAAVALDRRGDPLAVPRDAGHPRGLGEDCRRDLVAERVHHGRGGAQERDACFCQSPRERWVLARVAPPRPDGVHLLLPGYVDDQLDVRVVERILPSGNLDEGVRQPDVLHVRVKVVLARHSHEVQRAGAAELEERPLPHGHNGFGGGHPVVGDQDPADAPGATMRLDILRQRRLLCHLCTGAAWTRLRR
mmetsp:Transcript_34666/g.97377  ORF Transcript_34666/g.97377 Transcript_34666/m.97377 type:complete len:1206 (-) Transcript_34666:28-3645(-)